MPAPALAQTQPKPATAATKAANETVLKSLPFGDKQDFEDAQRGFIARPEKLTIKSATGAPVWDLEEYKSYIGPDKPAPDTVNPSLWRNAQLGLIYGLFKVTDRIYQVRGYDLSVMTFIEGDSGLDRRRSAHFHRDGEGGLRPRHREPRQEAGRRRDLQPLAYRPLRRRTRHRR